MLRLLSTCVCMGLASLAWSQSSGEQYIAAVGFYNLENLFDTLDSPNTNDFDFTPNGEMRYNTQIYNDKLNNLSDVISKLADKTPDGVAMLGVAEIENRAVLEDLVKMPKLAKRNYQIVHFDSPDRRGIDVALLYNPKYFRVSSARLLPVSGIVPEGEKDTLWTRDILYVKGMFAGEPMHVMVGHWPSRRGGEKASEPLRCHAAGVCRKAADSIMVKEPHAKIVIMGDLNDDPVNKSVAEVIGAKGATKDVKDGGFFNPFYKFYKNGIGTLAYNDSWNLFDQIMVSEGFLPKQQSGFHFDQAVVFNKPFLTQKTDRYKGYPWRTYVGAEYVGGYSDHFPTFIYLKKNKN